MISTGKKGLPEIRPALDLPQTHTHTGLQSSRECQSETCQSKAFIILVNLLAARQTISKPGSQSIEALKQTVSLRRSWKCSQKSEAADV